MGATLTIFQSIILGAVQGVTEFLPVSSSGHLFLARHFFSMPQVPLLFDVFLHVATLLVVLFYYRDIVWKMIISVIRFLQKKRDEETLIYARLFLMLIIATVCTTFVVLALRLLPYETDSLFFIACSMLCTALILTYSPRKQNSDTIHTLKVSHAWVVGFAQGLGTLPGISRSGITISSSLLCGLKREDAGKFAFLLSIPAILGALVLTSLEYNASSTPLSSSSLIVGSLAAMVTGFFSLKMLLWIVSKARLWYFSIYLTVLSFIVFFSLI